MEILVRARAPCPAVGAMPSCRPRDPQSLLDWCANGPVGRPGLACRPGCPGARKFRAARSADVRFVGPNDAAAVDQFRAECCPDEWETGGLDEVKHHLAAWFQGERIVAMAGYRPWTDIAGDPCVLTHPGFEGRGYGTAAVSAVVEQRLKEGRLRLYQTLEANRGAVKIALISGTISTADTWPFV